MARRTAGRGTAALLTLSCAGELPDANRTNPAGPRGAVAVWEFPAEAPERQVSLWPRGAGTPERKKRMLHTEARSERLHARVDGPDPGFEWHFATPIEAAVFRAEVIAAEAGALQLFWSSRSCPTYHETCSATGALEAGQNVVVFHLDRGTPIRELRLDLPDKKGATLSIGSLTFSAEPRLDTAWVGRETVTVSLEEQGLGVSTREPDPWLLVATPGLDASWVGSIEITLRRPAGPPQLFWDGPCGVFSEACSVVLGTADAGAATHRAELGSREWRGPIRHLRLDPGPGPGDYRIESIVLGPRTAP